MHKQKLWLLWIVLIILSAILACNLPGRAKVVDLSIPATQTALARAVQDLQDQQREQEQEREAESPQLTDTPTLTQGPTQTSSPTLEPPIEHITQPGEPERIRTWISDISSEPFASENRTIGDSLNVNLLERPFTAEEMAYQPYLDIIKTELGPGGEWLYMVVILEGELPDAVEAIEATYAIEIDLDRDGHGDWLISAQIPTTDQWTTDGVKVWRDSNPDVGGQNPMIAEAPLSGIDGYDELVFDEGHGEDPDAAWVRRAPTSPNQVQLAFKHSLIDSASTFLWGGWSDEGVKEPGWFDYNDHFTLEQAGSPLINNDHYPLKELYSLDNTCRWTYGFEPTTSYPGLCPLPTPTPTYTPTPRPTLCPPPAGGCPSVAFGGFSVQYIWNTDRCECVPPSP
jgi:hypothetical protein